MVGKLSTTGNQDVRLPTHTMLLEHMLAMTVMDVPHSALVGLTGLMGNASSAPVLTIFKQAGQRQS
jgi:hypothetical protein